VSTPLTPLFKLIKFQMRKLSTIIIILLSLMMFSSCNKKSEGQKIMERYGVEPEMAISEQDTQVVLNLTNKFLTLCKNNQIDEAMSMLYYYDKKNNIVSLPSDLAKKQRGILKIFHIYSYNIEYLKFYREDDSQVKYSFVFNQPAKGEKPATITGLLRPIRKNGKWYLTAADTDSQTHSSVLDRIYK